MNDIGYNILKERYSKPIKNANSLTSFIQKMYLHNLDKQFKLEQCVDNIIDKMPEKTQGWALAFKYAGPIGFSKAFGGLDMRSVPQPFYDESLEIGNYMNDLGKLYFCNTPMFLCPNGRYENCSYIIMSVNRGQLPDLTKEELERCKLEIASIVKYDGINVINNVYGSSTNRNWYEESLLKISGCKVEKDDLKFLKENFELLKARKNKYQLPSD